MKNKNGQHGQQGSLEGQVWLDTKELATYLKVSVSQIHNLTSNGYLTYYKMGRRNRYLQSEIDELLLSKRIAGLH